MIIDTESRVEEVQSGLRAHSRGAGMRRVRPDEALEDEQLFHVVELTSSSQIRARTYTWEGQTRFDLRTHARRKDGTWVATQRGVSVPKEKLPELLGAVQALVDADDGLVTE